MSKVKVISIDKSKNTVVVQDLFNKTEHNVIKVKDNLMQKIQEGTILESETVGNKTVLSEPEEEESSEEIDQIIEKEGEILEKCVSRSKQALERNMSTTKISSEDVRSLATTLFLSVKKKID